MEQQLDKLNRTDLIKLVGEQVLAELADEQQRAEKAIDEAREVFRASVAGKARQNNATLLINMAAVCGAPEDSIRAAVTTRIYADEPIGDVATVVFTDAAETYEQRMKLTVQVPLSTEQRRMAREWQRALEWKGEAEQRDKRVSAIRENVRKDLVAELLKQPEGAEVLDAAKRLAKAVKERLEGGGCPTED